VVYAKQDGTLDLDISFNEPENGLVASLLQIEGKPPLSLAVKGSGPIDGLNADLTFAADGKSILNGQSRIAHNGEGFVIASTLGGPVSDLLPANLRPFFGGSTNIEADLLLRDAGGFELTSFNLTGGQIAASGSAASAADGFLNKLKFTADINDAQNNPVVLPSSGGNTSIRSAHLEVDYGSSDQWTAMVNVAGLVTPSMTATDTTLNLSGVAVNLDNPDTRRITFNGDGLVSGIKMQRPASQEAIGESIGIGLAGLWNAGKPIQIAETRLLGKALEASLSGELQGLEFNGRTRIATPSIAPFSALAGRELSGAIDLTATGSLAAISGSFDLTLDGQATDLTLDMPQLDGLIAGNAQLAGRIGRNQNGLFAENFLIQSPNTSISANGDFSSTSADFGFNLSVNDLSKVDERLAGSAKATGTAKGKDDIIALEMSANIPSGRLTDLELREGALSFSGAMADGNLSGRVDGNGFVGGHRLELGADVVANETQTALNGLAFNLGGTHLTGNINRDQDGLFDGQLDLDAPDISTAAALALVEATGSANGTVRLVRQNGQQQAQLSADLNSINANGLKLSSGSIAAGIADLFGVPVVNGTLDARSLSVGGFEATSISARASAEGNQTKFTAEAGLPRNARARLDGTLARTSEGFDLLLQSAQLVQGDVSAVLDTQTHLAMRNDVLVLDPLTFKIGGGRLTASGTSGETLDLNITLNAVPLSIVNAVQPGLGLSGTLSGNVDVTGTTASPSAKFSIDGNGLNAASLSGVGISSLSVSANGTYRDSIVDLSSLAASGSGGLSARASGRLALIGTGTNLSVSGTYPLALANRMLGNRGTQLRGTAELQATVSGHLTDPNISGRVVTANAEVIDPLSNLRLQNIATDIRLNGQSATISRFSGELATGGSISASGTVSLDAAGGMPADLSITLNNARYADGNLFVATASGSLTLSGPLMRAPRLSGNVQLHNAEITIADFGGQDAVISDVTHITPSPDAAATLERALPKEQQSGSGSSDLILDINVIAPNQVFVRGRGIDAELGGQVRLTGRVSAIQPVGGFQLIRGRMSILGQRIDFTSGRVTLIGDLDPFIDMTAETSADTATISIVVTGPASDLDIRFTSQPELPQDEVLSLLIFQRSITELSPLQLARLAGAAAELAGGGGNSLVDSLREAAGLDDLDIVNGDDGSTAVRAGRYIQDNVYLSVEAGSQGENKVSIDLDLNDDLTARGSTSNSGDTSIGIFYEKDF
jgi:translocation and assembly module TamB